MQVYQDRHADLTLLTSRPLAVIGNGNQGRGLDILAANWTDKLAVGTEQR